VARVVFTEELIRTFYDKISLTYPQYSLSTIDKIVRAEFIAMKIAMTSGDLESFRLQYLFNIRVPASRIIKQLKYMYREKEKINPERFNHYLVMMLNHIKNNELKFEEYYERIRKYTGYTREEISRGQYIDNGPSVPTN